MTRDRELVSDPERNRALLDIIENVRDCKIKLISSGRENLVRDDGIRDNIHRYEIKLSKPSVKGIDSFTALNHECFHILFESPIKILYQQANEWATTNGILNQTLRSYYKYAYKLLEDQRIESLGGKLWLGTGKRFLKMREKRGDILLKEEQHTAKDIVSPTDLLLMIRYMQGEHYKTNKYFNMMNQALKEVEFTGKYGALKVMIKIKPILDEWWLDNIHNNHKGLDVNHARGNDMNSWIGDDTMHIDDMSKSNDIDEQIEEERKKGGEMIQEINDRINETTSNSKEDLSYVKYVERPEAYPIYDDVIASSMKKLFRKLSMISKEKINDQGNEIDIESYITNKIEGKNLNRCLIDKKLDRGISLLLSIDVSSSMIGDKIETTRKMVGTLFKSVEGLPNIEIKAQTWSSNAEGKITIQDINSFRDVGYVSCGGNGGGETPTHLAIDYATRTARRMRGEKKLIILLTDGHPQYHKNNFRFPMKLLITMTKKSILRAARHTPNMMFIHIGSDHTQGLMKELFGSRFMHTATMNEASETIIKRFRDLVVRTMLK